MNLTDALNGLYRFFHYTTSPPAATTTRLTSFINDVHKEILTIPGLRFLRDDVMAVTAKANIARTGLMPIVERIQGITDRGNNRKLIRVSLDELRLRDPSQKTVGTAPERYALTGYQEVQFQSPNTPTGLWAVSSSASDTAITFYVESVTTGGYRYTDSATLNGLTRVQLGSVATRSDHAEVVRFYLSTNAVGYVSLYDASTAGNELARIEPARTFARYLAVEWHPIQTADVTLYCDFTRTIPSLVNGTDEPLLPESLQPILLDGAKVDECLFTNDPRLAVVNADFEKGKRDLMAWVMNDGDRITSLRPRLRGRSSLTNLGTGYPADSWY